MHTYLYINLLCWTVEPEKLQRPDWNNCCFRICCQKLLVTSGPRRWINGGGIVMVAAGPWGQTPKKSDKVVWIAWTHNNLELVSLQTCMVCIEVDCTILNLSACMVCIDCVTVGNFRDGAVEWHHEQQQPVSAGYIPQGFLQVPSSTPKVDSSTWKGA